MNPWCRLNQNERAGHGRFGKDLAGHVKRKFDEFQSRAEYSVMRRYDQIVAERHMNWHVKRIP